MDEEKKNCPLCRKELTEATKVLVTTNNGETLEVCNVCEFFFKKNNTAYKNEQENSFQNYYDSDFSQENQQNSSSGWIIGMRIFAWIIFVVITISGIISSVFFWANIRDEEGIKFGSLFVGLGIIALGLMIAFLTVAMIMIFLDMAEDIKAIRNNTQNKEK